MITKQIGAVKDKNHRINWGIMSLTSICNDGISLINFVDLEVNNMVSEEQFKKWEQEVQEETKAFNVRRHGDRIKEICKTEKITQEQLAEVAGVDTKTVSRAVNGEGILSGDAVIRIYNEWGYFPDWIYGISALSKDSDSRYFVDIRDLIQIEGDKVKISIKEYLYKFLKWRDEEISEFQGRDSSFNKGIKKQQRRLHLYNHWSPNYYSACINFDEFKLIVPEAGKEDT